MQTVTKAIGWTYTISPWTGQVLPMPGYSRPDPATVGLTATRLPTNPVSYPSVGREPGTWPINPSQG